MDSEGKNSFLNSCFKKWDILLVIVFIVLIIVSLTLTFSQKKGNSVEVYVNGKLMQTTSINSNKVILLEGNDILIENGYVLVQSSTCKNQVCVSHAKISLSGQSIACLPNKVVVKVVGKSGYDFVVGG